LILPAAFAARADYLYWQVELNTALEGFDYARALYGEDISSISTVMEVYDAQSGATGETMVYATDQIRTGETYVYSSGFDSGNLANYIMIEMWREGESGMNDELLAQVIVNSSAWHNHAYTDMQTIGATPLMIRNVPEPSSGLMLLIGCGLLALKRRRSAA